MGRICVSCLCFFISIFLLKYKEKVPTVLYANGSLHLQNRKCYSSSREALYVSAYSQINRKILYGESCSVHFPIQLCESHVTGYSVIFSQTTIESQDHLGWKIPFKSSSRTVNLTLPSPPLNNIPECRVYMSFKYLQGW